MVITYSWSKLIISSGRSQCLKPRRSPQQRFLKRPALTVLAFLTRRAMPSNGRECRKKPWQSFVSCLNIVVRLAGVPQASKRPCNGTEYHALKTGSQIRESVNFWPIIIDWGWFIICYRSLASWMRWDVAVEPSNCCVDQINLVQLRAGKASWSIIIFHEIDDDFIVLLSEAFSL